MASSKYYGDTNGIPKTAEGRVTHLGVKEGDIAHRIVTVGSKSRAETLSANLQELKTVSSSRGFICYTGKYQEVLVSIVATGMGTAMMDFLVREARAVLEGPMAIVRLGTCGGNGVKPGIIVVNSPGAYAISRQPEAWIKNTALPPYTASSIVSPNKALSDLVYSSLASESLTVVEGLNASTDSFYSSQGRIDPHFDDRNHDFFTNESILRKDTISIEMESFHLLHLASCSKPSSPLAAATTAIVCADRVSGDVIIANNLPLLEQTAGAAVIKALVAFDLHSLL